MPERCPRSSDSPSGQYGTVFLPFSFLLCSTSISWCSPCLEIIAPFLFTGNVGCDASQKFFFVGTDHMNWPVRLSAAEHQATVASGIVRVIFDNLAMFDHLANFSRADHALRSVHLSNRMRKEKIPLFRRFTNSQKNVVTVVHCGRLHVDSLHFNTKDFHPDERPASTTSQRVQHHFFPQRKTNETFLPGFQRHHASISSRTGCHTARSISPIFPARRRLSTERN